MLKFILLNYRLVVTRRDIGFFIGFVVIIGSAIYISLYVKDIPAWSTNVTLVVEITVGIIVTLVIMMITMRHEEIVEEKINTIKEYVGTIKNLDLQKRYDAYKNLLSYMKILEQKFSEFFEYRKNFHEVKDEGSRKIFEDMLNRKAWEIQPFVSNNILDESIVNVDNFSQDDIKEIKKIQQLVSRTPSNSDKYHESSKSFEASREQNKKWISEMEKRVKETKDALDK